MKDALKEMREFQFYYSATASLLQVFFFSSCFECLSLVADNYCLLYRSLVWSATHSCLLCTVLVSICSLCSKKDSLKKWLEIPHTTHTTLNMLLIFSGVPCHILIQGYCGWERQKKNSEGCRKDKGQSAQRKYCTLPLERAAKLVLDDDEAKHLLTIESYFLVS